MVNVAGRSKGCAPCRRRKVKCDLSLPQCQRCIDLRIACPGPRVGAFFVHCAQKADNDPLQDVQQLQTAAALIRIPPAATSCRAAAWDQLFVAHFVDSFGLPGGSISAGPTWLETLPSFLGGSGGSNSLATASIRSAAMLSYGTWAHDRAIQADSYRWYAAALAQLSRSINAQSSQPVPPLETALCAAVMLIHFETWAGTAPGAWAQHVRGAAALLHAAGPEAVASRGGFVRAVFSHLRFQVFIATMQDGTLHAFAREPWLEVPFREQRGTLFDELVDALFAVQRCLFALQQAEALSLFSNVSNTSDISDISNNINPQATGLTRDPLVAAVGSLVEEAAGQLSAWNERYMPLLRPASLSGHPRGNELILKAGVRGHGATTTSRPGLPEAALISLFHAGRLIVSQLASITTASVPDTALEDSRTILEAASSSAQGHSPPSSKLRPFMMLPGLKIASIWSPLLEVRADARALLLDEQILASPMADIALTSEGYSLHLATSILKTSGAVHFAQ